MEFRQTVWYMGYKGFDSQMRSEDLQFEENMATEEVDPYVNMWEEPLDVWLNCPPGVDNSGEPNEYAEVGACGSVKIENPSEFDTEFGIKTGRKISTSRMEVGKKLPLGSYIEAAIAAIRGRIEKSGKRDLRFTMIKKLPSIGKKPRPSIIFATHEYSEAYEESYDLSNMAAVNTGATSTAGTSGRSSVAACTGNGSLAISQAGKIRSIGKSAAVATGELSVAKVKSAYSAAIATGACSAAEAQGIHSVAICTYANSAAYSSGDCAMAVATANNSRAEFRGSSRGVAIATAEKSAAIAKCRYGVAAATSPKSLATSSGRASVAIATGEDSQAIIAPGGERSIAIAIGARTVASADGKRNIAFATGYDCRAKGTLGNWIVCAELNSKGEILDIKSAKVDGAKIKPNTCYYVENGEFVEMPE